MKVKLKYGKTGTFELFFIAMMFCTLRNQHPEICPDNDNEAITLEDFVNKGFVIQIGGENRKNNADYFCNTLQDLEELENCLALIGESSQVKDEILNKCVKPIPLAELIALVLEEIQPDTE